MLMANLWGKHLSCTLQDSCFSHLTQLEINYFYSFFFYSQDLLVLSNQDLVHGRSFKHHRSISEQVSLNNERVPESRFLLIHGNDHFNLIDAE